MKHPNQKPDPRDTRNLVTALVLSAAVIFGWSYFVDRPHRLAQEQAEQASREKVVQEKIEAVLPVADEAAAVQPRAALLAAEKAANSRIPISTESLHGSINLVGGRIDDLTLAKYRETVDATSPEIVLLAPAGTENPYYADFGWQSADGTPTVLPGRDMRWQPDNTELTPSRPLTLSAEANGLQFTRTIAVDSNYMFTITDRVENRGTAPVSMYPYGRIMRAVDINHPTTYVLHEGPLGIYNGTLSEDHYSDLLKNPEPLVRTTTGGWFGFTDKYWLVAMAPPQDQSMTARTLHASKLGENRFQSDYTASTVTLQPNESTSRTTHLFAGAKEVRMLANYEKSLGIPRLELAIDFGWFYYITKPFFYAIDILAHFFGNFGVAILIFTVIIKLALFPIANHAYISMTKMKALAPKLQELRETYKNDPQRMGQETMGLYKKEQINPLSGCWPMLIQIPIFFALYKVLYGTIEMRHAPFYGWITDLSAPDPTNMFNLFGLLSFTPPSALHIGVLPLLMGISMWLQMKMNPPPTDEAQKFIFGIMPFMFTWMMAAFPAGLVLYWTWSNVLSILQQYVIMRRMHVNAFT